MNEQLQNAANSGLFQSSSSRLAEAPADVEFSGVMAPGVHQALAL